MTTLTGAAPQVVRIDLRDDAMRPVGELEVDVDPHGADFRPAITGAALPCLALLACMGLHSRLPVAQCS